MFLAKTFQSIYSSIFIWRTNPEKMLVSKEVEWSSIYQLVYHVHKLGKYIFQHRMVFNEKIHLSEQFLLAFQ